jgi:hypothetical protein
MPSHYAAKRLYCRSDVSVGNADALEAETGVATDKCTPDTADVAAGPDDRLPTFHEVDAFDANAAWARLTAAEQRRVGILAVRLGFIGGRLNYEHPGWTDQQIRLVEYRSSDLLSEFFTAVAPLWSRLLGWIPSAATTTKFLRMMS